MVLGTEQAKALCAKNNLTFCDMLAYVSCAGYRWARTPHGLVVPGAGCSAVLGGRGLGERVSRCRGRVGFRRPFLDLKGINVPVRLGSRSYTLRDFKLRLVPGEELKQVPMGLANRVRRRPPHRTSRHQRTRQDAAFAHVHV